MEFTIEYKNSTYSISTYYKSGGDSLLLFIHGLGCTKEAFSTVLDDPRFKEYSILIPDLIGYGNSSKLENFSYSMEDQANIIKILLEKVPYKHLSIVAHSMGNAIGLILAEELKYIQNYINIEGNLIPEDSGLLSRKSANIPYEEFKNIYLDSLRDIGRSSNRLGWKLWVDWTYESDPLCFYRSCISLTEWSDSKKLLDIFERLSVPKYYIYGEDNIDMQVLKVIKDIPQIAISNSGHFVMNDNPDEFYSQLEEILIH